MEKNVDLAYKTLDYIRDHPQEWNQREFLCGTTACFAGWAALISLGLQNEGQFRAYQSSHVTQGVGGVAVRALGWSETEACHVFYNDTKDFAVLERLVKEVLNGEVP